MIEKEEDNIELVVAPILFVFDPRCFVKIFEVKIVLCVSAG